jgi:hypothetical protein
VEVAEAEFRLKLQGQKGEFLLRAKPDGNVEAFCNLCRIRLARLAADGRFVGTLTPFGTSVIDTRTDKQFPARARWSFADVPGFGLVSAVTPHERGVQTMLIPSADKLDLRSDLLELWVQVAVRGELGPDGAFTPWNEPTWEKKRQELAAQPSPYPDFPFPGQVVADRLHWLRQEYLSARDGDKPGLAKQLLNRAEAVGDRVESRSLASDRHS